MKKWLVFISLFIIIAIGAAAVVYLNAVEPVKAVEARAIQRALEETELTEVIDFSLYHGEETFYIIEGMDDKGIKLIAWIPEQRGKVIIKKSSDGLTRDQAVKKVLAEAESAEIISVKLGMENGIPLWEIHSRTKENLLNYHSIVFGTGEWLKKIENL